LAEPAHRPYLKKGLAVVGPDLLRSRLRLQREWIWNWLAGPQRLHPQTKMPDLRLGLEDRTVLLAYLTPSSATAKPAAADRLAAPSPQQRAQGAALARRLGCPGCHRMSSLEGAPPAGPDLDGFGDKPEALLDWGEFRPWLQRPSLRSKAHWTELKLQKPLLFDRPPGVLLMPWQKLRPGELRALGVLLRSLSSPEEDRQRAGLQPSRPTPRNARLRQGEYLVERQSCRGCHALGGRGGALGDLYPLPADRPPLLDGEGAKVQPQWLYQFLGQPTPIRPWLTLRMPTFNLLPEERQQLVAYFAAQAKASFPFVEESLPPLVEQRLSEAQTLFQHLQCLRCHLLTNAATLQPGELAPDLALGRERLRRRWIQSFLLQPQELMPNTQMPTLFPLADEDDPQSRITPAPNFFAGQVAQQIDALADLSLYWGSSAAITEAAKTTKPKGKRKARKKAKR
jgi:cytochrome c2